MIVVRADQIEPVPTGVRRYDEVVTLGDPMPVVEVGPDDDATILYTSGTTGIPQRGGVDPSGGDPGPDGVLGQRHHP